MSKLKDAQDLTSQICQMQEYIIELRRSIDTLSREREPLQDELLKMNLKVAELRAKRCRIEESLDE